MKRYSLHLKNELEFEALASLGLLHENGQQIVLGYSNLADPKAFEQTLLENCQVLQLYQLEDNKASASFEPPKDYALSGLNDIACMLCLSEVKDSDWLVKHKLRLMTPKSFYLSWTKQTGFKVEWA